MILDEYFIVFFFWEWDCEWDDEKYLFINYEIVERAGAQFINN